MHTAIIVGVVILSVIVVVNSLFALKYRRQWKKYIQHDTLNAQVNFEVVK